MRNGFKYSICTGLIFFIAILVNTVQSPASEPITLDNAVTIALGKNPFLSASRSQVDAARARNTQAAASYLPQVNATGEYNHIWSDADNSSDQAMGSLTNNVSRNTEDDYNNYSANLTVTQLVYDFGRTPAQIGKSRHGFDSSRNNFEAEKKNLVRDVKDAYFEALKKQALLDVSKESFQLRKRHLEQAIALYKEGMRPRIDMTRSEVEVSQARLKLVTAKYDLQKAMITLERLLGGPPVSGEYSLVKEDQVSKTSGNLSMLVKLAMKKRSELSSLESQIKASETGMLSVKRSSWPSLNAKGSYQSSGNDFPLNNNWKAGLFLKWELFTGFRQSGQLNESRAETNRLKALLDYRKLIVTEEVTQTFLKVHETKEAINAAEIALRQAKENLALAQGLYESGESDAVEFSDAQVLYTESKSYLIQVVYNHQKAWAGLEYALGGKHFNSRNKVK